MERHRVSGRRGLGFALASCTMILWGGLPLVLEVLLRSLPPLTLTWFRFCIAAVLLYVFLRVRRGLPALRAQPAAILGLLALATVFLAANYVFFLLGLERTNAPSIQVMMQLAPLLLALGAVLVFGERFTPLQWVGFAILVLGLAGFFASQLRALAADLERYLDGAALTAAAAVTWAIYGLAQKQLLTRISSLGVMFCIFVGSALLLSPGAHPGVLAALDATGWGLLLFSSVNTLLAYAAFAAALEHWEASRVSAVIALTPLATLCFTLAGARIWPAQIDAASVTPLAAVAAVVVVIGSLTVALGARAAAAGEPGA